MNITPYLLALDIAVGFWALFMLIGCAGVLFAVLKLTQVLSKLEAKIDPLADKGQQVMENVDHTLGTLRTKAESMLNVSEETVRNVASKIDTTSALVEGAVARPAISLSSIMAGINRGLETWRGFEATTHTPGINGSARAHSSSMETASIAVAEPVAVVGAITTTETSIPVGIPSANAEV